MQHLEARQIKQRDIESSKGMTSDDIGRWGIYEYKTRSFRAVFADRKLAEVIAAECNLKANFGE